MANKKTPPVATPLVVTDTVVEIEPVNKSSEFSSGIHLITTDNIEQYRSIGINTYGTWNITVIIKSDNTVRYKTELLSCGYPKTRGIDAEIITN